MAPLQRQVEAGHLAAWLRSSPPTSSSSSSACITFRLDADRERLEAWLSEFSSKSPAALEAGVVLACGSFRQRSEALRCFEAFVTPRVRAALSPRERALLKLNLVDGASIDELAPLSQVSRATVARWLAAGFELSLKRFVAEAASSGDL
jgi:DNA-directed RNA polymerase specialized sigma24 family protein